MGCDTPLLLTATFKNINFKNLSPVKYNMGIKKYTALKLENNVTLVSMERPVISHCCKSYQES